MTATVKQSAWAKAQLVVIVAFVVFGSLILPRLVSGPLDPGVTGKLRALYAATLGAIGGGLGAALMIGLRRIFEHRDGR